MKYMKIILLFFVCLFVCNQYVDAKEEMYGNIKLRSIGVGNISAKRSYQRQILSSNASNYYMSYGLPTEKTNIGVGYQNQTGMKPYAFEAYDKTPFNEYAVETHVVMRSFGGGEDPNHPGTPIGDALPFVLLLAGVYVYIRSRK